MTLLAPNAEELQRNAKPVEGGMWVVSEATAAPLLHHMVVLIHGIVSTIEVYGHE